MKRMIPLYEYSIWDMVKSVCVFYGVLLLLIVFVGTMPSLSDVQMSGIEFATTIFLFVAGLNSFKSGFLFASASGYTRRQYFLAVAGMLLTVATIMSLVGMGITAAISAAMPSIFTPWPQVYPQNTVAELGFWYWVINLQAVALGLVITLAFYRLNIMGKWLLALSPVFLGILLPVLDSVMGNGLFRWFGTVFEALMGSGPRPIPLLGAGSIFLFALLLFALARLLVRGVPIKEQES